MLQRLHTTPSICIEKNNTPHDGKQNHVYMCECNFSQADQHWARFCASAGVNVRIVGTLNLCMATDAPVPQNITYLRITLGALTETLRLRHRCIFV